MVTGLVKTVNPWGGVIAGDNGVEYAFKRAVVHDNVQLEPGDAVSLTPIEWRTTSPAAEKVKLVRIATPIPPLTAKQEDVAVGILEANKYLETIQTGHLHIEDGKGYDNSRYLVGFRLQQMWEDEDCSAYRPLVVRAAAALLKRHIKTQVGPGGNHPMGITFKVLGVVLPGIEGCPDKRVSAVARRGSFVATGLAKEMAWDFFERSSVLVVRSTALEPLEALAAYCAMEIDPDSLKSVPQLTLPKGDTYRFVEFLSRNPGLIQKLPAGQKRNLDALTARFPKL